MGTEKVIEEIERTLRKSLRKMRTKSELASADTFLAVGKVINSYRKLLELKNVPGRAGIKDGKLPEDWDYENEGDPTYHSRLEAGDPKLLSGKRRLIA